MEKVLLGLMEEQLKLSVLKDIASTLIDIHGQHQNQALFNKETHLDFLDLFGE